MLLSCRKSSAGFMGQNQLLAAIETSATTAKLQLCDRRLRRSLDLCLRNAKHLRRVRPCQRGILNSSRAHSTSAFEI